MTRREREKVLGISVWWREDRSRWFADFRSLADQGGGREVLRDMEDTPLAIPPRENGEVPVAVQRSVSRRLDVLEGRRKRPQNQGRSDPTILDYARRYLEHRKADLAANTIQGYATRLRTFMKFVGPRTHLSEVGVADVNDFVAYRRESVADSTIKTDLDALETLYNFAVSERAARHNPVARLQSKPSVDRSERVWLEIGEAARYMKATRKLVASSGKYAQCFPEFAAVQLLTGGSFSAVAGLRQEEVDLEAGVVRYRHNQWRDLKTDHRERDVPLWPQLRQILEDYEWADHDLLFPSPRTGRPYTPHLGKNYGRTAERTKDLDKAVTSHTLRHTYCAARIQTLDQGAPVSLYTVAREMGHKDLKMIQDHYGHLMDTRHRAEVVEYVEADVEEIGRAWHQTGTNAAGGS